MPRPWRRHWHRLWHKDKIPARISSARSSQEVAKIIQVRSALGLSRQIFLVTLGGFDTHGSSVAHAGSAPAQVDQALSAFYQATVELGLQQKVLTFTMSDFARTLPAR